MIVKVQAIGCQEVQEVSEVLWRAVRTAMSNVECVEVCYKRCNSIEWSNEESAIEDG